MPNLYAFTSQMESPKSDPDRQDRARRVGDRRPARRSDAHDNLLGVAVAPFRGVAERVRRAAVGEARLAVVVIARAPSSSARLFYHTLRCNEPPLTAIIVSSHRFVTSGAHDYSTSSVPDPPFPLGGVQPPTQNAFATGSHRACTTSRLLRQWASRTTTTHVAATSLLR